MFYFFVEYKRQCKEYRKRHGDKKRAQGREYYRESYAENPQKWLKRNYDWERRNPEWRKLRREHVRISVVREVLKKNIEIYGQPTCVYCEISIENWHIDHIKPLAKGGSSIGDNLCIACPDCNRRKHVKSVEVFMEAAV